MLIPGNSVALLAEKIVYLLSTDAHNTYNGQHSPHLIIWNLVNLRKLLN